MKKRRTNRPYYSARRIQPYAYPNAAERSYFWHRLLDGALAVATAVGAVVVLVFLLML